MILKTFGCSHTKGAELKNRSISAWPVLVGKKLNMLVKNYGSTGASNDHIIKDSIQNSPKTEKLLIIIMTTHPARVYWPIPDATDIEHDCYRSINYGSMYRTPFVTNLKPKYDKKSGILTSKIYSLWVKYHFNFDSTIGYQRIQFKWCKELLESRGHTVYMFNSESYNNGDKEIIVENKTKTMNDICQGMLKGKENHFLEDAQEVWANYVYKIINQDKNKK